MKEKIKNKFPEGFLIGVSSSSYQSEGAWNEDGKGENIWDRLTHTIPEAVENRDNGDVACDSYHKYKEDVALIKDIGFNVYRFSLSWARILPDGDLSIVNQKGIDYYHNLIDELLNNGIQPMVTIYHWDLPQPLQDMGGWLNPLIVDYFEDYSRFVFQQYGDKVKFWNTINEPLQLVQGYSLKYFAPYLNLDKFAAEYVAGHTLLKAHARAYRVYDKEFREKQNGKLSIVLNGTWSAPKNNNSQEDKEAAERANQFELGWLAHPIYSEQGDYPSIMRKIVDERSHAEGRTRSRLPVFTREEIEEIRGTYDFLCMNHYTTRLTTSGDPKEKMRYQDAHIIWHIDDEWPTGHAEWLKVVPWGLRDELIWLKNEYNNVPVYITENGYCDKGQTDDKDRILYYKGYITEMLNAINDHGCHIIGYNLWCLLDVFEWLSGYKYRDLYLPYFRSQPYSGCIPSDGQHNYKFGIVRVNFDDPERKRTPKASSAYIKRMISSRTVPDE